MAGPAGGVARVLAGIVLAACAVTGSPPLAPLALPGGERLAPGLRLYDLRDPAGPWAIEVLDIDRLACWQASAVKAGGQAVGRATTTALVRELADTGGVPVGGAVNADFFLFAPPGVPVGPHVDAGRLVTGPGVRPAIWFDSTGMPTIGQLRVEGILVVGADTLPIAGWNRLPAGGTTLIDRSWGPAIDSAPGHHVLRLAENPGRIGEVDAAGGATGIPVTGVLAVLDSADVGRLGAGLHTGAEASWRVGLAPVMPWVAVGGFPVLVRDSAVAEGLDRAGGAGFGPMRHPRTAVGIAAGGRRLLLVTVDGRQPGWSAGMTLQELAALLLRLGATEALNLDGGGSTTMVVARAGGLFVANRTSDTTGERPVANALAVVRRCR